MFCETFRFMWFVSDGKVNAEQHCLAWGTGKKKKRKRRQKLVVNMGLGLDWDVLYIGRKKRSLSARIEFQRLEKYARLLFRLLCCDDKNDGDTHAHICRYLCKRGEGGRRGRGSTLAIQRLSSLCLSVVTFKSLKERERGKKAGRRGGEEESSLATERVAWMWDGNRIDRPILTFFRTIG